MGIYMLNKIPTEPEIFASKVAHVADKAGQQFHQNFDFEGRYLENQQVTRGFMYWFFLSWGIDYRIKTSKTKFERITSRTFNHPISHCEVDPPKYSSNYYFIYNLKKFNGNQIEFGLLISISLAEFFDLYVLTLLQYFTTKYWSKNPKRIIFHVFKQFW